MKTTCATLASASTPMGEIRMDACSGFSSGTLNKKTHLRFFDARGQGDFPLQVGLWPGTNTACENINSRQHKRSYCSLWKHSGQDRSCQEARSGVEIFLRSLQKNTTRTS